MCSPCLLVNESSLIARTIQYAVFESLGEIRTREQGSTGYVDLLRNRSYVG